MPVQPAKDFVDLRNQILVAAERRFRTFGYNKTTMAEIAEDTRMSAANLYRYFSNKQDIAAACAQNCLARRTAHLCGLVRQADITATQKLYQYAQLNVAYTHEQAANEPRLNELVATITTERQDIVHESIRHEVALLVEILQQGVASGEFNVEDNTKTAQSIHSSMMLFKVPLFLPLFSQAEFEATAKNLMELLLKGIQKSNK